MDLPEEITPELVEYIRKSYRLNWHGIHGWAHWNRVCDIGLRLAQQNGADRAVVALFAFTHDMARMSDGRDPQHGPRAARQLVDELQGSLIQLSAQQFGWLVEAVKLHTAGLLHADLTVMTCWDSDRLDLGRVGIVPAAHKLCTVAARDQATMAWAYARSLER